MVKPHGYKPNPPPPSMAALPVDQTKTDPKPAFYKLQFGDDITGFSYYVRTLQVMIGRNCVSEAGQDGPRLELTPPKDLRDVKAGELPPPDERNLGEPTKPPLDSEGDKEMSVGMDAEIEGLFGGSVPGLLHDTTGLAEVASQKPDVIEGDFVQGASALEVPEWNAMDTDTALARSASATGVVAAQGGSDAEKQDAPMVDAFTHDSADLDIKPSGVVTPEATLAEIPPTEASAILQTPPMLLRTTSEDQVEVKMEQVDDNPMFEAFGSHSASSAPPPDSLGQALLSPPDILDRPQSAPPASETVWSLADRSFFESLDPAALEALALAATAGSPPPEAGPPPPPPPPERRESDSLEHVDVDLGSLKSVSRNHARIIYLSDLGSFCLEIFGRNGVWIDNRFYVRGSTVPLANG
jgi:hypothetical protein